MKKSRAKEKADTVTVWVSPDVLQAFLPLLCRVGFIFEPITGLLGAKAFKVTYPL